MNNKQQILQSTLNSAYCDMQVVVARNNAALQQELQRVLVLGDNSIGMNDMQVSGFSNSQMQT